MTKRVLVPLAPACEELEAITITDLLTRAGVDVVSASLDGQPVIASRGMTLIASTNINTLKDNLFDMIALPGGLPGANHLRNNDTLQTLLKTHHAQQRPLAAICAAPRALLHAGVMTNKTMTCYPGALDEQALASAKSQNTKVTRAAVEIDGHIITSRGPGTAMDFALTLIEVLLGKVKRDEVEKGLVR